MDLNQLIALALEEDLPHGDLTTDSLELGELKGRARLIAKEDLVLSGSEIFAAVMKQVDEQIDLQWQFKDGDFIWSKQTVATLHGRMQSLLKAERTALNFLGRMAGTATLTRCFVTEVEHTGCKILDTRKTTPLWRVLQKTAVRHGGGQNHRLNLSDAILLKDNHIRAAGGLTAAVNKVRRATKAPIEVECQSQAEVDEAIKMHVNWILLDNFTDDDLKAAVSRIPRQIQVEASGNMTLDRVRRVAEIGVGAISVGALTHSAPTADFSLEFDT